MAVPGFISDERILYTNLWRVHVIKNVWGVGVTIADKEIDCADRIVHETGIHEAIIVDSTKESECFLNNEGDIAI